ncbi:MAG: metalloregulator ArsR/SmtB family transcription factor [Firmicutes bacterium]|nr:metalloregulator ArsR/SmtB family transcription factor [Bacillota bacterium]
MPSKEQEEVRADLFDPVADVYKALADKTRLRILALLAHGELCVCELVPILSMSQPSVSQHLRKLRQAGLVKERKTAQWVYYSIDGARFPLLRAIVDSLPDVRRELDELTDKRLRVPCNDTSSGLSPGGI